MRTAYSDLEQLGLTGEISNLPIINSILAKLPFQIRKNILEDEEYENAATEEKLDRIIKTLNKSRSLTQKLLTVSPVEKKSNPDFKKVLYASGEERGNFEKYQACIVDGCEDGNFHQLFKCAAYYRLTPAERIEIVNSYQLCTLCLNSACKRRAKYMEKPEENCKIKEKMHKCQRTDPTNGNECNKWHHSSLHQDAVGKEGIALTCNLSKNTDNTVLLLVQCGKMKVGNKKVNANVAFDTYAQVNLCSHKFGKAVASKIEDAVLDIGAVGDNKEIINTKKYSIWLTNENGGREKIEAFGLERITRPIAPYELTTEEIEKIKAITKIKNHKSSTFVRKQVKLHLLLGMELAYLHPEKVTTIGRLVLYKSALECENKYIVGGIGKNKDTTVKKEHEKKCFMVRKENKNKVDQMKTQKQNKISAKGDTVHSDNVVVPVETTSSSQNDGNKTYEEISYEYCQDMPSSNFFKNCNIKELISTEKEDLLPSKQPKQNECNHIFCHPVPQKLDCKKVYSRKEYGPSVDCVGPEIPSVATTPNTYPVDPVEVKSTLIAPTEEQENVTDALDTEEKEDIKKVTLVINQNIPTMLIFSVLAILAMLIKMPRKIFEKISKMFRVEEVPKDDEKDEDKENKNDPADVKFQQEINSKSPLSKNRMQIRKLLGPVTVEYNWKSLIKKFLVATFKKETIFEYILGPHKSTPTENAAKIIQMKA